MKRGMTLDSFSVKKFCLTLFELSIRLFFFFAAINLSRE